MKENKFSKGFKTFFSDFKKFISRGNIVDMAVGVIIGSAFSSIVTALTNKIIMPLINLLLSAGGENGLEKAYTFLKKVYVEGSTTDVDLTKSIYIDWGAFITAVINFFLIALVLFLILKAIMKARLMSEAIAKNANKDLIKEKAEVRKQAKIDRVPFKTAWKNHLDEKKKAEEARKAEEEAKKPVLESQDDILRDIRALLKVQVEGNAKKEETETQEVNE